MNTTTTRGQSGRIARVIIEIEDDDPPRDKITVDVRGGVAYCDDPRVEIIDHDNREDAR